MRFSARYGVVLCAALPLWASSASEAARAVLAKNCLVCHGQLQTSGLDVREIGTILKGGKRGPAVVAGKPDASLLHKAVAHSGDLQMPPGKKLPAEDVAAIRAWIQEGARWETESGNLTESTWWSFRKPVKPAVPAGKGNPIDAFILAKLQEKDLKPVVAADRRTLIRRVYYELHGLPPTPAEVQQFVNDAAPDAWDKLIDRLLASPRYGERWGRHWLDVVRYADTGGFETDLYYANA